MQEAVMTARYRTSAFIVFSSSLVCEGEEARVSIDVTEATDLRRALREVRMKFG
jgi:hypothetical protein